VTESYLSVIERGRCIGDARLPVYILYTVIRFVSISAKFCICTVVGLNWTHCELKYTLASAEGDLSIRERRCIGDGR
jgi:hypothetical protein